MPDNPPAACLRPLWGATPGNPSAACLRPLWGATPDNPPAACLRPLWGCYAGHVPSLGVFLGPCGPGIVQAHFDFGIAAGYVNSGQRVYHGRGNSTALSRLEGKSNATVGATAWVCSWSRSPAGFRPLVRQAGTYQVCGWLAAGYHFN
jgi:hypothetical protein